MKYINTYEALTQREKDAIKKSKNEDYTTFNLDELRKDCREYDIFFMHLLKEIMLHEKILFECFCCFDDDLEDISSYRHSVIGDCLDIKYLDEKYWESDILVKIKGYKNWHTLYNYDPSDEKGRRVRVFNFRGSKLLDEIEMKKNMNKYNL